MIEIILKTELYRSVAEGRTDVEIWQDNCPADGWDLFSIVTFRQGNATMLAEIRAKDGHIEHRVRDENGDDQWVETK